jgi:hypothetical protein
VRSSITLRKGFPDATGDTLSWSWKGAVGATDANDFGAPLDTTDYTLCLFSDEQLLSRTTATAGALCNGHPCWHLGSSGYRYANPRTSGIRRVRLSAPAASPPTIRVAGHGFWLLLPPSLALPELRVQLLALDAQEVGCWEAEYATPAASTPTRFHAPD